ncbi:MAG: hypothetical protein ACLQUZ_07535 [Rhizomicrobium sp.]
MKRVLLAAATTLLATAAYADPLSVYYTNTLSIVTGGKTSKMLLNQDGTYEYDIAGGAVIKGTFVTTGDTTCLTQTTPPPPAGTAPACQKYQNHQVGDTWTDTSGGQTATITLVAGR